MKNESSSIGTAMILAWPDTVVPQANAWYDEPMRWLGFNKNGTYRVGHSAIVLAHPDWNEMRYYDFGRYGTKGGLGRVRNSKHEMDLHFKATPTWNQSSLQNTSALLTEISQNRRTNGTGRLIASICNNINIDKAIEEAERWRKKGQLPYGPFVHNGTNCSRFTSSVLKASEMSLRKKIPLHLPLTVSPSPWWNVVATCGLRNYYEVKDSKVLQVSRMWWPFPHKKTHKTHEFLLG